MSRKLENNGLWESSRMILPEHREQYLHQRKSTQEPEQESTTKIKMPTEEELQLVRDFVLLPMMLTIVEKNRQEMEQSSYALRSLYVSASILLMNRIHSDLASVRKSLKDRSIKIYEEERAISAVHYRFICRGYEHPFAMMRDVVRAEISVRIAKYVADIFKKNR